MATPNSSLELTPRGKVVLWLAALTGGAAWLGGDEDARIAAALLTAPVIVDFVAKQRRLHLTAVHLAPRTTMAGALYTEQILIEHRGRRPLRHCRLHEPRSMRNELPALLPTLTPFQPQRVELRQRSMVRSHIIERVFVLESEWPLGMFASRSIVRAAATLITEPARVTLRAELLEAGADVETAPVDRSLRSGPEFYALREHNMDEDARAVHALRSATLGALVRRTTRGRTPTSVGVVLDLRRAPGTPRGRGLRRCEWSLGACATLVEELLRRGARVRLLLIDSTPELIDVDGPARRAELMMLLAEANLSPHVVVPAETVAELDGMTQSYWIAAGGFADAPELQMLPGEATVVEEAPA